jgi:hypothetical protein
MRRIYANFNQHLSNYNCGPLLRKRKGSKDLEKSVASEGTESKTGTETMTGPGTGTLDGEGASYQNPDDNVEQQQLTNAQQNMQDENED